jgi:hypothetical protein
MKKRFDAGFEPGVGAGPVADLWRNTLAAIPAIYGRLVYLSGLRQANTGRYEHHGLALLFGADEAHQALRFSHVRCFREWIGFSLEQKKADLDLYLASFGSEQAAAVRAWNETRSWRNLVPGSIRGGEKKQFLADVDALMALLRNVYGVSAPDPDA